MEKSLLLLKPDALAIGLEGQALERLEGAGLRIVRRETADLCDEHLWRLYGKYQPDERPITAENFRRYLLNRPVVLYKVAGVDAIRRTIAVKRSLRERFGNTIYGNVAHSPDSPAQVDEQWSLLEATPVRTRPFACRWRNWAGWTLEEIREALVEIWASIRWGAEQEPWQRQVPEAPGYVRVHFPERWTTPFDVIVAEMSSFGIDRSAAQAVRAAFSALYDPNGYQVPVWSVEHQFNVRCTAKRLGCTAPSLQSHALQSPTAHLNRKETHHGAGSDQALVSRRQVRG